MSKENGLSKAPTHSPIHIFERSHRRDNILPDIRLGNKKRVRRDFQRPNLTGGDDDVNRRPPVSYRSGQFQPIHGTGHVDIGKNEIDIPTGFENGDRLVGIVRNDDDVSGLCEFFCDEFPDQGLIFDNQDYRHFRPSGGHMQGHDYTDQARRQTIVPFDGSQVERKPEVLAADRITACQAEAPSVPISAI